MAGFPLLLQALLAIFKSLCSIVPFCTPTSSPHKSAVLLMLCGLPFCTSSDSPALKYGTKSTFFCRSGVTLTADITTSKRLAARSSMMVSNFVVTIFACKPMRWATAVIKSTSKPTALLVVGSIDSCGGNVVSLPTVNTPGVIRSFGAATVGVAGLGVGLLPVVVLLPHAASKRQSTTMKPITNRPGGVRCPRALKQIDLINYPPQIEKY